MSIVIGVGTHVTGDFGSACIASAQWNAAQNTQRLYCLGQNDPYDAYIKPTETVNFTIYADTGPTNEDVTASDTCDTPPGLIVTLTAIECGGGTISFTGSDWLINSYSYSKDDPLLPGQETWGLMHWVTGGGAVPLPGAVIRGIAEGQTTDPSVLETGVTLAASGQTTSSQGSVQAGGIGRAFDIIMGVVTAVGGGGNTAGEIGQGSANIPYTPLWI
jgi:hypothetical protein